MFSLIAIGFALDRAVSMNGVSGPPATPEELEAWRKEDYWNRGDYDPMVMFVVIPAIIQIMALGMMGAVMYLNTLFF